MTNYIHELEFTVRDYECDFQGVVNNSIYMNYLEHARHELLKEMNKEVGDIVKLSKQNILPMVYKAELEYKDSLKSGDVFIVKTNVAKEGLLKAIFFQDIYKKSDNKLMFKGKITAVVIKNGKPIKPDILLKSIF